MFDIVTTVELSSYTCYKSATLHSFLSLTLPFAVITLFHWSRWPSDVIFHLGRRTRTSSRAVVVCIPIYLPLIWRLIRRCGVFRGFKTMDML
ncbi:hypothetical protein BDW62DRAFT_96114 [Aspergillus aurantiobrunneus]